MSMITVSVWDATGSKRQEVELPDDVPVNRVLVVLIEKMNLPRTSPDGQRISYKFHHKATGTQLLDHQSLAEAGVRGGDVLRMQPEITAGSDLRVAPEHRFSRFELIGWWDQARLAATRVVVVGAGALGNEIVKNLALLGVGRVYVVDLDCVEVSNLSRSVLFRPGDEGRPKADTVAGRAREIYPELRIAALRGDVVHDVGLGLFRWAHVVLGGLDNREARLHINRQCARAGTPWIDGAIEALSGVARVFRPPGSACYECTLGVEDWRILEQRRSCALLTREEMELGKVPTTPTSASLVAAIQCQEALKLVHGLETLEGGGWVFEGVRHESYRVAYRRSEECLSHDPVLAVRPLDRGADGIRVGELLAIAREELGSGARLEFGRELIRGLDCPSCGARETRFAPVGRVSAREAPCPACGAPRALRLFHAVDGTEDFLDRTLAGIGIPPWDVVVAAAGERSLGFELTGDRAAVLGPLGE